MIRQSDVPERLYGNWALNLPERQRDMGTIFLDDYIQRHSSRIQVDPKVFLGYKTSKKLGEDLYLKETENEFILGSFLNYMF